MEMSKSTRDSLIHNIIRINESMIDAVLDNNDIELQDLQILLNYYVGLALGHENNDADGEEQD